MPFIAVESCEPSARWADQSGRRLTSAGEPIPVVAPVSAVHAGARLIQIVTIVSAHVTWWACCELWRRSIERRGSALALAGARLTRLLEALGPTFIKVGQALSTRPDLLPPEAIEPLKRLQDSVAPFSRPLEAVERALGRRVADVFEAVEPHPVASASIAQVHRARLRDGRTVAVKIRRPDITGRVAADFWWLRRLADALATLPSARSMPLRALVDELAVPVLEQLDFRIEAANNRRLRDAFAQVERIHIPALIDDLCTESVLTMEYVDGLCKVTSDRLTAQERRVGALTGLRALYRMIFDHGFVHADMHPGNVFLRPHGEFVMLDFGLVARLGRSDLSDFVGFFYALATNHGRDCADIVLRGASHIGPRFDATGFEADMVDLIRRHSGLRSREFELARFVWELMAIQRRFDVHGSTNFITTLVGMMVFEGVCQQLVPDCDFQQEARGYLITARYRRR